MTGRLTSRSPFETAIRAAKTTLRNVKGFSVNYVTPDETIAVRARQGATAFRMDTEERFNVVSRNPDFKIAVAELVTSLGAYFEPQAGHHIEIDNGDTVEVFEVVPINGEPEARFTGTDQSEFRVHTTHVETRAAT